MVSNSSEQPLIIGATLSKDEVVFSLDGELDMATAPDLSSVVETAVARDGVNSLVLQLAGLRFTDSTGMQAILQATQHAEILGKNLTVREPSDNFKRVVEILGVDNLVHIEEPETP